MHARESVGHNGGIKCHYTLYGTPTEQKTAHHIIQGTQTDVGIVLPHLLHTSMRGIVANLLNRAHVAKQLPVVAYESVNLRTAQHLAERLAWLKRHVCHGKMVSYEPLQCLAGVAGALLWESLLKDFRLIAVCV